MSKLKFPDQTRVIYKWLDKHQDIIEGKNTEYHGAFRDINKGTLSRLKTQYVVIQELFTQELH